jgi:hypothetical protein
MQGHSETDNTSPWALTVLVVVVHVLAFGVAGWSWNEGYRFARPLLAGALMSTAIHLYGRFGPPVPKRVVMNRLGLAAVLAGCTIVGPTIGGVDARAWMWLLICVQTARALWIAPRGARPLPAGQLLFALAALGAWMYATPWMMRAYSRQVEEILFNATLAAAVIVIVARRSNWVGGLLFGGGGGLLVVLATAAAWLRRYEFTLGIATLDKIALAAAGGAVWGVVGRIDRQMLGLGPVAELRGVDLDNKAGVAARRLAKTLHRRGALRVTESPNGKKKGELIDEKAVPVLIEALSSNDLHVRFSAADVLGRIGPPAEGAIQFLWHLVGTDPQPGDRPGEALARIGARGVEALVELFHSDSPAQRAGAAHALRLAAGHSAVAVPALVGALDDSYSPVRQNAAASLGELGDASETVMASLEKTAADLSLAVRYAARRSLDRLNTKSPPTTARLATAKID